MLLPSRQDGEVLDESLPFAFTALGIKEKSSRRSAGKTGYGGWLRYRHHRRGLPNLKRVNKFNRFHHNPPVLVVCSVYHELVRLAPGNTGRHHVGRGGASYP
jgi:hypothetical protein